MAQRGGMWYVQLQRGVVVCSAAQLRGELVCSDPSVEEKERRKAQPSVNDVQKNNKFAKSEKTECVKAQPRDKTPECGKGRQIIIGEKITRYKNLN